jgi:hypothetical protein
MRTGWVSIVSETSPAKQTNNKANNRKAKKTPAQAPPSKQKRSALTNQNKIPATTNKLFRRMTGKYNVGTIYSGENWSIYLDRMGLVDIIPLRDAFKFHEKFKVHGFRFEYTPSQPVTVGGTIYGAPDYDPMDTFPDTIQELSNTAHYKQGSVTDKMIWEMPNHVVAGEPLRPALFTGPGDSNRFTSFGQFFVTSESSLAVGTAIGTMVLHYDITFVVPQAYDSVEYGNLQDMSIQSVMDNVGAFGPAPVGTTTVTDAFISVLWDHVTARTLDSNDQYSGIVKAVKDGSWRTKGGKPVNPGTRVWFQSPAYDLIANVLTPKTLLADNAVGKINIDRGGGNQTEVLCSRTLDSFLDLQNVRFYA